MLVITSTGNFTLLPVTTQFAPAGGSANFALGYQPLNAYYGTVGFTMTSSQPGISASFSPLPNGAYGSTMNVSVPPGLLATTYQLAITATGLSPVGCTGSNCTTVTQVEYAWLTVSAGKQGFSVSAAPVTATTVVPGGSAQYTIVVIALEATAEWSISARWAVRRERQSPFPLGAFKLADPLPSRLVRPRAHHSGRMSRASPGWLAAFHSTVPRRSR